MTKKILLVLLILLFALTSCADKKEAQNQKKAKKEKTEITAELYCNIYKELDALMMEKYWPQFKGKEFKEIKDLYIEYQKEEAAIYEKYNVEYDDLASFFRKNFSAVEECRKNDPDYKEYSEKQDAKGALADFAVKNGMGE